MSQGIKIAPELERLIYRLREAGLSTKRFMRLDGTKKAWEPGWQLNPHDVDDLPIDNMWGVAGREGLVPIDADTPDMATIIRTLIPPTFETRSATKKLPHFYLKVVGGDVPNNVLVINSCDKKGSGEIRAQNYYLVAPGTVIHYKDSTSNEEKVGRYTIAQDLPIATMQYANFMAKFKPYIKSERITPQEMKNGVDAGYRHPKGIRYATYLCRVLGLTEDEAIKHMAEWNIKNRPPMDYPDLVRMVHTARGYADQQPLAGSSNEKILAAVDNEQEEDTKEASFIQDGNKLLEEVLTPDGPKFAVWDGSKVEYVSSYQHLGITYIPITDDFLTKNVVWLPTQAEEYG